MDTWQISFSRVRRSCIYSLLLSTSGGIYVLNKEFCDPTNLLFVFKSRSREFLKCVIDHNGVTNQDWAAQLWRCLWWLLCVCASVCACTCVCVWVREWRGLLSCSFTMPDKWVNARCVDTDSAVSSNIHSSEPRVCAAQAVCGLAGLPGTSTGTAGTRLPDRGNDGRSAAHCRLRESRVRSGSYRAINGNNCYSCDFHLEVKATRKEAENGNEGNKKPLT